MFESLRSRARSLTVPNTPIKQSVNTITQKTAVTPASPRKPAPLGLFVLNPTEKNSKQDIDVDIIAIHSLGGHAHTTWRHDSGHLWLRDSLPAHITNARIMTFSYDSAAAWCKPSTGIEIAALELLKQVRAARQDPKERERRIVFICHSLGGIILKKALLCAQNMKQYESLRNKIVGIMFMGTPHRESKNATAVRMLRDAVNCARLDSTVRLDFLETIEVAGRVFCEISQSSLKFLESPMKVVSVYEQEELEPWEKLIVEPFSALLGIPNEKVLPAAANHRTIVRFSPAEEAKYLPVRSAITELVSVDSTKTPEDPKTPGESKVAGDPSNSSPESPSTSPTLLSRQTTNTSTPTIRSAPSTYYSRHSGPPATILSTDSRGMPDTNRAMAQLIESRIRNHAATRPEAGVRAHGASYHARRAHLERIAAQQEARERELEWREEAFARSQTKQSSHGIEAWRTGISHTVPRRNDEPPEWEGF